MIILILVDEAVEVDDLRLDEVVDEEVVDDDEVEVDDEAGKKT